MDNYEIARDRAREYFLTKENSKLLLRNGVHQEGEDYVFRFLGTEIHVSWKTGVVTCGLAGKTWEGDFSESLSVYDWLCDAEPDAQAAGEYCPVHSLPGILVGGSGGLMMGDKQLSRKADENPEKFQAACAALGGKSYPAGDMGFIFELFPDLSLILKFYHSDEDFPAQITLLWDRNTLSFVRYETVYYIAGVLFRRLRSFMN